MIQRQSGVVGLLAGLLILALPLAAQQPPSFDDWLAGVRTEALAKGISQRTVDEALTGLTPEPVIIARDRLQPEHTQSLEAYIASHITAATIARARTLAAKNADLLDKVRAAYSVPPPVMISIWGMESNFGQFTGSRAIVQALATLAFDPRRPTLFRTELFDALTIVDRGLMPLAELKGSWAGAMGQPQFLPSSYLKYGVDFDGDGRADIWKSDADVFASMANYLKHSGWDPLERWGREVAVSKTALARIDKTVPLRSTGCRARHELTERRTLDEWKTFGVTLVGGASLPNADVKASLARGRRRYFLVYKNYESILDYNCSNAYAITVGLLADRIGF